MFDAEKVTELDKAVRKLELLLAHRIETGGRIEFPDYAVRVVLEALSSLRDAAEDAETEWGVSIAARGGIEYTKHQDRERAELAVTIIRQSYPWPEEINLVCRTVTPWLPVPEGNQ